MKTIKIKKNGKIFHQFILHDAEIVLAEKLGISREQYIMERSKIELEERHKRNERKRVCTRTRKSRIIYTPATI